jgi:alkylation response protein AidB-like acyl-CoA dehydrogenase
MVDESRQEIGAEEILGFRDLARQYSKKSLLPIFTGDYPDGDLNLIPEKLEIAFSTGIAASPDESMPGSVYGIWGSAVDQQELTPSLVLLETIAETCGGVAMSLHAQGVASNLACRAKAEHRRSLTRVGLCLQEGFCPPFLGTIIAPAKGAPVRIITTATPEGGRYVISGAKSFVYSMNNVDAYMVFARVAEKWGCFTVFGDDSRMTRTDVGARTGLRACRLEHIELNNVELDRDARIDDGDARELVLRAMGLNWAGMSAIALGIAKGALNTACRYAEERYQGGSEIGKHPAVKILLGGSDAAIRTAESMVYSLARCRFTEVQHLARPAAVKLQVLDLCARAVTDSLQSFGGYGYMEDFGVEKRLRDITVLKSAFGSPIYLKQLLFDLKRVGVE